MTNATTSRRLATCALVLAGATAGLTACGGNDDSSKAADKPTTKEFCDAFSALATDTSQASSSDLSAQIAIVKKGASKLEDVGAPKEMPSDAAHGMQVFVDAIQRIDDHANESDLEQLGKDVSAADQKDAQAFIAWAQPTCITGSASPSASPSSS